MAITQSNLNRFGNMLMIVLKINWPKIVDHFPGGGTTTFSGGQGRGSHSARGANAPPTFGPVEPRWEHAPPTFVAVKWVLYGLHGDGKSRTSTICNKNRPLKKASPPKILYSSVYSSLRTTSYKMPQPPKTKISWIIKHCVILLKFGRWCISASWLKPRTSTERVASGVNAALIATVSSFGR